MIFKLFLKYIFKANTEEEKLRASVIYGWSLAVIGIACAIIGSETSYTARNLSDTCYMISLITLALFIFRYTSVKPLLGAAAGGITVIAIGTIFDSLLNRRDNAFGFGALMGVLLVLGFMIVKNIFVSWYYLLRESFRYYKFKKEHAILEETILTSK